VDEHAPDVLALAECTIDLGVLLVAIKVAGVGRYRVSKDAASGPTSRLLILTRLPRTSITALPGNSKCAVRHIRPIIGSNFLLLTMHLLSKLHLDGGEQEQSLLATRLRLLINEAERRVGHRRSVVMGDLNMDGHEPGITSSETFQATTERREAAKGSRYVQDEERFYFYNPLPKVLIGWPPGTYYRAASGPASRRWHTFDHVFLRPNLLSSFRYENLAVLTMAGKTPLLTNAGYPDKKTGSDHLPLLLKI